MSTSLAYGQLFTYSQWERLPEEERQVYLDMMGHHFNHHFPNFRNHFLKNQALFAWGSGWGWGPYGDGGNTTVVAFPQATPQKAILSAMSLDGGDINSPVLRGWNQASPDCRLPLTTRRFPPHWIKVKHPNAPAVKREVEEDWGR